LKITWKQINLLKAHAGSSQAIIKDGIIRVDV